MEVIVVPRIMSFRRTGTNLLAKLLHDNLVTSAAEYAQLHCSHSTVPSEKFIATYRPLLPTMMSLYHMRERFGVQLSVSFEDFIRVPYDKLPEATTCASFIDGTPSLVCFRLPFTVPLPQAWVHDTTRFAEQASVVVHYSAMLEQPLRVVQAVAGALHLPMRGSFTVPQSRVGLWPSDESDIPIDLDDVRYLQRIQDQFTFSGAGARIAKAISTN